MSKKAEFIDLYLKLFAGRPDAFAIRTEWEKDGKQMAAYLPSTYSSEREEKQYTVEKITRITDKIGSREYGPEAVAAHLEGKEFLGIYPLHSNSQVSVFALDFDGDTFEAAWEQAMEQRRIFQEEARINLHPEISRSGNGVHLWGFLEEPVDARKLRIAIRQFLIEADTYDRMFPNQDSITELRPLGNLIALPLFGPRAKEGKGVFVDDQARPLKDQREALVDMDLDRIALDWIYKLYEDAPEEFHRPVSEARAHEGDPEGLTGAYKLISPYGCEWMRWHWEQPEERREVDWWMLAHQCAQFENGRELFHQFSARSTRYDERQTEEKYNQAIQQNAPHSCEYIREHTTGPACRCDEKWPDQVRHPYDVAELSMRELIAATEKEITTHSSRNLVVIARERAAKIEKDPEREVGFRYGNSLDEYTSMRAGELIVIGARPSIGKTALGNDLGINVVNTQEANAYIASMEMTADQLGMRFLAREAQVDHGLMITGKMPGEDWAKVDAAVKRIQERPHQIFVDDRTRDTQRLLDVVGEWVYQHGKGPLVIDYLQLAKKKNNESTFDAVSRFAYEYKWMAKLLDIPVIALTQLNRSADEATEESATYDHWLRNSGDIEQAADVILFLLGERSGAAVSTRTLVIHKERHRGAGHRVKLDFHQAHQQFGNEGTWLRTAAAGPTTQFDIGTPIKPLRRPLIEMQGGWGGDDDE